MNLSNRFKITLAVLGVLTFTATYIYFDMTTPPPPKEIEYIPLNKPVKH